VLTLNSTERLPGTFGTLVICLPSQHVGGDVVLSHGDATTTLKTAECSRFDMTYLAWYVFKDSSMDLADG